MNTVLGRHEMVTTRKKKSPGKRGGRSRAAPVGVQKKKKKPQTAREDESSEELSGSHPLDDYLEYVQGLEKKHASLFDAQLSPRATTQDDADAHDKEQNVEENVEQNVEEDALDGPTMGGGGMNKKKTDGLLSLPPPLVSLDAVPEKAPDGVILIEHDDEMLTSAEYRQFSRPARYFDEDASVGSTCFKCGMVGHFARDCTNPAKQRPCFLCALFGHSSSTCPNSPCFRCGESGHMARDCLVTLDAWENSNRYLCRRCGTSYCRASGPGDVLRAEGKCNQRYSDEDLRMVTCMACGHLGHANCKGLASTEAVRSCYNCGEMGHIGFECKSGPTPSVFSERRWSQREHRREHRRVHRHEHQHHATSRRPLPMQRLGVANTWHKHVGKHGDRGHRPMKRAFDYDRY